MMRYQTIGIAVALLLICGGIGLCHRSQHHSGETTSSEPQYVVRGQDPVKPPNLLRTSSPQPLPPNPLRSGEQPIPANIDARGDNIRPVAGPAPSPFDFPTPPTPARAPKAQSFDDLTPQGNLLEAAGFPASENPAPAAPVPSPQPLPPPMAEPRRAAAEPFAAMPEPFPEPAPAPAFANLPEPQPAPREGLSSIDIGEPNSPLPLQNFDPLDEDSPTIAPSPLHNADPFGGDTQTVNAVPPTPMAPLATPSPAVAGNLSPMRSPSGLGSDSMEGTGVPGPSALEGPQTPHITIEKVLPAEVVVDQPMVVKTVLRNTGRSPARDIVLRDRVPQGTRLLSTSPEGTMTADGELVWALGNLNANEQTAVEMRILPYREGEIGSVASVGYTAEASARIAVTRPMLQVQVKAPQEIQLGQTANIEITISNPGSATATGVVLTAHLPDGLFHKDGKTLENRNIDTLKPKETKRLTLPLTCTGAGNLVNRLVVRADGGLSVEEKTTIRALAPMLNLEIVGPKERFLERRAGYRLVVANPGTATAKDVDLVVYLPTAVQFVSTNQSGVYEKSTHTVHWALAELPPQESGEIELVVLPIKLGEHAIRFAGNGQNGLKAEETQSLFIDGLAALSFEVACLSNLVEVGRDTVYEIRVSNRGTKSSGNVVVMANLSEGMDFVSAEGPVRYNSKNGVIQFEPLAQLEAKGERVYRITAKCLADGDHRVSVRVQSDELRAPITKEESTRVFK